MLLSTHAAAVAAGVALGIYLLPILVAPPSPTAAEIGAIAGGARFTGEFRRDLAGSDLLHHAEGAVAIGRAAVAFQGRVTPGPDFRLYLSPGFVETKDEFLALRSRMVQVGAVRSFENFIVPLPGDVDPAAFDTLVIWCESFEQFISAAKYR